MTTTEDTTLPALIEPTPADLIAYAGRAAQATRAIVEQTAQQIGAKRYVRVEGWQAIALAHGCVTSSRDVRRVEGGVAAIGEVRRRDTGAILAEAEGFVGEDEAMWARRPEFARRAMAQTRAISRACRAAFAHVVVMMAAGLETTPAEEMECAEQMPSRHPINSQSAPPRPLSDLIDQQSAARAQQPARALVVEGTLVQIDEKHGKGKAGPWTRWGCRIIGANGAADWYGTFNDEISTLAYSLEGAGVICTYTSETVGGKQRHTIVALDALPDSAESDDAPPPPLPEELL